MKLKRNLLVISTLLSLLLTTSCGIKGTNSKDINSDDQSCGITAELRKILNEYNEVIQVSNGLVLVNSKSAKTDETGQNYYPMGCVDNLLIPCQYDACLYDQETNLVYVQQNGKQGYVDLQNQVVVPIEFDLVGFMYGSNLFKVRKDGREGLYDLCGNCTLD